MGTFHLKFVLQQFLLHGKCFHGVYFTIGNDNYDRDTVTVFNYNNSNGDVYLELRTMGEYEHHINIYYIEHFVNILNRLR